MSVRKRGIARATRKIKKYIFFIKYIALLNDGYGIFAIGILLLRLYLHTVAWKVSQILESNRSDTDSFLTVTY